MYSSDITNCEVTERAPMLTQHYESFRILFHKMLDGAAFT